MAAVDELAQPGLKHVVTQAVTGLLASAVWPLRRKGRAHPVGPVRAGGQGCLSLGSLGQQNPQSACAELAPVREVLSVALLGPSAPHSTLSPSPSTARSCSFFPSFLLRGASPVLPCWAQGRTEAAERLRTPHAVCTAGVRGCSGPLSRMRKDRIRCSWTQEGRAAVGSLVSHVRGGSHRPRRMRGQVRTGA